MPKQDSTLTDQQEEMAQTAFRLPLDLYKAVAHEVAERGPGATVQGLWIEAMRKFLKLD